MEIEFNPCKWLNHLDKLQSLAKGSDVFPVTIELDLVNYCNHHCHWCVDPVHMTEALDFDFVKQLLVELKTLPTDGIVFKGGGEPTLHPQFGTILQYTKEQNFEIGVVTNGSNLTKWEDAIINAADYIRISLDGPTAESHALIHGTEDFHNIIKGVASLTSLRKTQKKRHPIIGLSFVFNYQNRHLIRQAIRLGDELTVDYILLRPPFCEEVGRSNCMSISEKQELFANFDEEKKLYAGKLEILIDYWISDSEAANFSQSFASPRRGRNIKKKYNGIEHELNSCLAAPLMAVITANKKIFPCCNLRFLDEWSLGVIDYNQGETFKKIWKSATREKIMGNIRKLNCIKHCTHPLSRYNEIISYLQSPKYHKGFI